MGIRHILGSFIILKVQIDDKVHVYYVLVNINALNKDKGLIQFLRKLHGLLQTENLDSEENIILGGDFNCPLNPALDKHCGVMISRRAAIDSIKLNKANWTKLIFGELRILKQEVISTVASCKMFTPCHLDTNDQILNTAHDA